MTATELKPPTKPIPDWQAVRDAWVRDVEALVAEVHGWCKAEGWADRVLPRILRDNQIGEHVAPALLLQVEFAQLLLDPVYPSLPGEEGLAELYLLPQYDNIARLIREPGGWEIIAGWDWHGRGDPLTVPGRPFERNVFVAIVNRMVADARQHPL